MDSVIAEKYARALFEAARSAGQEAAVGEALAVLERRLGESAALREAFTRPRLAPEAKAAAAQAALGGSMPPLLAAFLRVLFEKKRGGVAAEVARSFARLASAAAGRVRGRLTTALPLDAPERAAVKSVASRLAGKPVDLVAETDERLLGGFVLVLGDRRLDASVAGQLQRLRQELAN